MERYRINAHVESLVERWWPEVERPEVRVLVQLRAELGREIEDLRERVATLEEYVEALDTIIGQGSFATADAAMKATREAVSPSAPEPQTIVLTDKGGTMELATMEVVEQTIRVIPVEHAIYDIKRGAFATFFVDKILGGFHAEDKARAESKEIKWEDAFDYNIVADDGILEEIVIRNYGTDARLNEIRRALQWALEKTYAAR
jgi:hypothetical protein